MSSWDLANCEIRNSRNSQRQIRGARAPSFRLVQRVCDWPWRATPIWPYYQHPETAREMCRIRRRPHFSRSSPGLESARPFVCIKDYPKLIDMPAIRYRNVTPALTMLLQPKILMRGLEVGEQRPSFPGWTLPE
jgi:hypothetical protein